MPQFIPGVELSRRFYEEAVRPALDRRFPGLPHAAARIGWGSDVLGFDTEMSTDHGWGPSVTLFLRDEDAGLAEAMREALRHELPREFYGYPVGTIEAPGEPGTRLLQWGVEDDGPVEHLVEPTTARAFFRARMAYDVDQPVEVADWLTISSQTLREVTAGAVHHDGVGALTELRERFAYYPFDVWLYLLASGWQRIGQEQHLMPRAGYAGDEPGSALMGSRLVRDVMSLCFLMEKQYAPYPKWFGTAFKRLSCAESLSPALWQAQRAETWQEREAALCEAYEHIGHMHNALGITAKVPVTISAFHGRPFRVVQEGMFIQALVERISEPEVKRIATQRNIDHVLIGGIDQFSDSTDLRAEPMWRATLKGLYR
jgi:hypothetical protein